MTTPVAGSGPDTIVTTGTDSWLNPEYLQTFAPASCRRVTLPVGVVVQILGNNPQRVAFTIFKTLGAMPFPAVGPVPQVATFGIREDSNTDVRTFGLSEWLSFVMGEWYALSSTGGDILVCEMQPSF